MRFKKIIQKTTIIIVCFISVTVAAVYLLSAIALNKTYDVPLAEVNIPNDAASIKEGKRLIQISHCGDCHNNNLTGKIFDGVPQNVATLVAPNLTKVIPHYSDKELVRLLRYGVKKDGRSVYIMPSFMYHELKEESVYQMVSYLRTLQPLPDAPGLPERSSYRWLGRLAMVLKKVSPTAEMISPGNKGRYTDHDTSKVSFGRYLTVANCSSCHGLDLKGMENVGPNLIIASSYNKEDFFKLMRTGVAQGNRQLSLMSTVTKNYLSYMTDVEIESIYAYLQTQPTAGR